jgi:hypothetical protein
MEPPVSYPVTDNPQGRKVYGKKSGCMGLGCFGIIGAIVLLLVIGVVGYIFVFPALTPNSISGSFMDAVIVPSKDGTQKLWILTDGSFNFIKTTKSPGRTSTGRSCYFCKTWTYIIDPKTEKVLNKIKTPYEDIITQIDLAYYDGKVWTFTREYGENGPRIEAFDSETGEKLMDTKQFIAKFPILSAGLTEVHYDPKNNTVDLKTKDGMDKLVYKVDEGKLYENPSELNDALDRDSTMGVVVVLASEKGSGPRKKLYKATGTKGRLRHNLSSIQSYVDNPESMKFFTGGLTAEPLTSKVFLEGIMYYQDKDCAIIIALDQLGKKSNRIMTCVDLQSGKEKWTLDQDVLFKEMKIDEDDDTFSSLFFTKDNIDVKRLGNLVVLQLKGKGIMGIDYTTGKKLWEMNI